MESDTQSALLGTGTTVVQTLIKRPVKEAVREAIQEERQGHAPATLSVEETPADTEQPSPPLGRVLGVVAGLAVATYLFRRRQREPQPGTTSSSIEESERRLDTKESSGPEDETDFGTQR
jgi:uncharacterized protein YfaQ (DUF2300 family)